MLNRKVDHSSNKTYISHLFDRFLAILLGYFAQWIYPGHSCPSQSTVSIQIVSQIPQPHLDLHPNQTNGPYDQPPRPLRLHPKDMFHTTPDSGTRPIALDLSVRQLLMFASLTLKMVPILRLFQRSQLLLRSIRRLRPYVSTAVIVIQKAL